MSFNNPAPYPVPLASGVSGVLPVANGGTNYSGGAFAAYGPPTVTAGSGSIGTTTATGTALIIGKLVFATVIVTWSGTVTATTISVTLPANSIAQNIVIGAGMSQATAQTFFCESRSSPTTFDVYQSYAVNTPAVPTTGDTWRFTLCYQAA